MSTLKAELLAKSYKGRQVVKYVGLEVEARVLANRAPVGDVSGAPGRAQGMPRSSLAGARGANNPCVCVNW